jgi:hypothetical protein
METSSITFFDKRMLYTEYLHLEKRSLKPISRVGPQFGEKGQLVPFARQGLCSCCHDRGVLSEDSRHGGGQNPRNLPHFAPTDFLLSHKIKTVFKERIFLDVEYIKRNVTTELKTTTLEALYETFVQLPERW